MTGGKESYRIKQFKDGSKNWWCEYRHFHLTEAGELILCAGGEESKEHRDKMIKYLKSKKLL